MLRTRLFPLFSSVSYCRRFNTITSSSIEKERKTQFLCIATVIPKFWVGFEDFAALTYLQHRKERSLVIPSHVTSSFRAFRLFLIETCLFLESYPPVKDRSRRMIMLSRQGGNIHYMKSNLTSRMAAPTPKSLDPSNVSSFHPSINTIVPLLRTFSFLSPSLAFDVWSAVTENRLQELCGKEYSLPEIWSVLPFGLQVEINLSGEPSVLESLLNSFPEYFVPGSKGHWAIHSARQSVMNLSPSFVTSTLQQNGALSLFELHKALKSKKEDDGKGVSIAAASCFLHELLAIECCFVAPPSKDSKVPMVYRRDIFAEKEEAAVDKSGEPTKKDDSYWEKLLRAKLPHDGRFIAVPKLLSVDQSNRGLMVQQRQIVRVARNMPRLFRVKRNSVGVYGVARVEGK